jgi:hypothetical protein
MIAQKRQWLKDMARFNEPRKRVSGFDLTMAYSWSGKGAKASASSRLLDPIGLVRLTSRIHNG